MTKGATNVERVIASMPMGAAAPARDALIEAVIAKIPLGGPWPRVERVAWLKMAALAFDVAFEPVGEIAIDAPLRAPVPAAAVKAEPAARARPAPAHLLAPMFSIDKAGFALRDGMPIDFGDVPRDAAFIDHRVGDEFADQAGILWRTGGYSDRPLPVTVQFLAPVRGAVTVPEGGVS